MPNAGNLTSEASVGQNDPVTDLIENAQSLGRFYMQVCQFIFIVHNLCSINIKSIKNQSQLGTCIM